VEKAANYYRQSLREFLQSIELLIHGTTLATNTLVTGTGAKVGMLTTENFRDIIEIRRGIRPRGVSLYNVFVPPYRPLVPRYLRLGVPERTLYSGEIIKPLDAEATRQSALKLREEGVSSVAICFLHSYANPTNEELAAAICEEIFGPGHVTTSHDILPVWREFERFSTTVVSAYVGPVVADYLQTLQRRLADSGFAGTLLMMLASGLVQTADQCVDRAVHLLGSGPAAAPYGALYLAREALGRDLISIDTGGTSFDVCVIRNGEVPMTTESWVEDHRVAIKMVDVSSIGAGGGSIAWVDPLGLVRVGPRSAGGYPGPACYANGSLEPTLTDAALVLGYLPADNFLGGEMPLSVDLAREALRRLGEPADLGVEETAQAIFRTTNSVMADKITEVCTRRGFDVRDFALIVGGGAGPLNAAFIAESLGLDTVFIPSVSSSYSAFAMLSMDLGRDYARSYPTRVEQADVATVARLFDEMEREARAAFQSIDLEENEVLFTRSAEMRYVGQFHEVEVPFEPGGITAQSLERAVDALHREHQALFSFSMPWMGAEFLTFRCKAVVKRSAFHLQELGQGTADASSALTRSRTCYWKGEARETPIYDGRLVLAGNVIGGPAIIEEQTTTIVIPEGMTCAVDKLKNYVLRNESPGIAPFFEREESEGVLIHG
jgi:N-methylhydantoinase A